MVNYNFCCIWNVIFILATVLEGKKSGLFGEKTRVILNQLWLTVLRCTKKLHGFSIEVCHPVVFGKSILITGSE